MPIFEDSGELAPLTSNTARPFHGVDLFFSSVLDTEGSVYLGVSQNEGVRILEVSDTTDELSFQWVGGSPAPSQGDTMDIWCLNAGGINAPGNQGADSSIQGGANRCDVTDIDVPSGTWGYVNFGDIGAFNTGAWHRFLVADLTGLTDVIDNGVASDGNSLMFVADEENYLHLAKTSGDKVAVCTSAAAIAPSEVRIRTN